MQDKGDSRQREKRFKYVFIDHFLGGEAANTPWSWCIAGGSKSQVHGPTSIGPSLSILRSCQWRRMLMSSLRPSSQQQLQLRRQPRKSLRKSLRHLDLELTWLTCWHPEASRSAQRSWPWLQTWSSSSTRLLALMAVQIFLNMFSSSFWMPDDFCFGLFWSSWLSTPNLCRLPHGSSNRLTRHRPISHGLLVASAQCAPLFSLLECEPQMTSAACVAAPCSLLGCSFPSKIKFYAMQREQIHKNWYQENPNQTCLMCSDCERLCSQVSHTCLKPCRWRRRIFWRNAISCRSSADLDFRGLAGSFQILVS